MFAICIQSGCRDFMSESRTPILFLSFLKRVLITQALSGKNVLIKGIYVIPVRKAFIFFIDL